MTDSPANEPAERARVVSFLDQLGRERRLVIRLDPTKVVPQFEQLRAQLSVMVAVGRLEIGSRLPTVRSLAAQLSLAPGTVARAFRELEAEAIIVTRGRRGTFVANEPPHSEPLRERREKIARAAESYLRDTARLGIDVDGAIDALRDAANRELPKSS